jgi:acetyl esterase/lipase
LHGGGLKAGGRNHVEKAAITLARLGFVAIAVEYRLLGEVSWPTPLDDVRTAIRSVSSMSNELGIDPKRVFAIGYSAGAHLALLAAAQSVQTSDVGGPATDPDAPAIAAIAAFFPPARISPAQAGLFGLDEGTIDRVSPLTFAASLPPAIIFCGDADPLATAALELHAQIRAQGRVADLHLYSDLVHEFVSLPGMMEITLRDAAEFFQRTVTHKVAFDAELQTLVSFWEGIRKARA